LTPENEGSGLYSSVKYVGVKSVMIQFGLENISLQGRNRALRLVAEFSVK